MTAQAEGTRRPLARGKRGGVLGRLKAVASSRTFRIGAFAAAVMLGLWLLYRSLSRYSVAEIVDAVSAVSADRLAMAGLFAAASYACLTFFDYLALRCVGKPLAYRRAALASFTSLSLGHSIGFAGLSSGAVRYRFYERWGLSVAEVAQVVVFCGITVALGLATLAGLALILDPSVAERMTGLSSLAVRVIGVGALAIPALYLLIAWMPERVLRRELWGVRRPPVPLALAQIAAGTLNFACVAGCLHQVLRHSAEVGYPAVASAYVAANTATLITHVPGGLGVVETVVQYLLPGADMLGPLLVFRFVYFLAPLALGLVVLAASERWSRRRTSPTA